VAVLWVVFASGLSKELNLFYLLFLPLIWIAMRHGLPGTALATLLIQLGGSPCRAIGARCRGERLRVPVDATGGRVKQSETAVANTPTVLIVDDDDAVRDSLALLLGLHGYRTQAYGSAEDFLDRLDAGIRGCVLLDLRLPGMTGLELQAALATRRIALVY